MTETNNKNEWWEWIKAILIALIVFAVVKFFLFEPIVVDGPSMQPTLHDRDHMIVNKIGYKIGKPGRFDIIVFHASDKKDFIKRVIGLPGDHVGYQDNQLYINGEKKAEPFFDKLKERPITNDFQLEDLPGAHETIPEGYVFVLGDNRTNSTDSRIIGLVPMDKIVGKTSTIYWPINRLQILGE